MRSLAWSRTHADLLASGGSDGQTLVYNLRSAPHYLVAKYTGSPSNAVVGLTWARTTRYVPRVCPAGEHSDPVLCFVQRCRPADFEAVDGMRGGHSEQTLHSLSLDGCDMALTFRRSFLAPFAESRMSEEYRDVETLIYSRDFAA